MGEQRAVDPQLAAQIVERSNDAFLVHDMAANIVWANDAVGLLGWKPSDLEGRSGFEMVAPVEVERLMMALGAMSSGFQPPSSAPFSVLAADGSFVECDIAPTVLGEPDDPVGIAATVRPTQDSRILRRLLQQLLAGDSAEAVLAEMLELLYHRNQFIRAAVTFIDEDGDACLVGDELDPRLAGLDADADSPWDRARSGDHQVLIEDTSLLPPSVALLATEAGLRDCWIVPVRSESEHIAMITLWALEGGPSAQLDTYSVTLLAQLIELILRWRRQTRELERAATRDPLTGLPNRRALSEFDAVGPRRNVGVLYIDLDRFKPVNDRLGHAAGDLVLRTVANRLQSAVRPTDIVARLGGDEFGIVCPGCTRVELGALADEVLVLLSQPIGVHTEVVTIGSSIGAAIGHDSVEPLLARADRALYDAKEAGRGSIRWADDL